MQFIDVGYGRGRRGVFNVTGEPIPFGRLLGECVAETGRRDAVLQWVPAARLLAAGVDVSRAFAAGLSLRPLGETIRDTLAWDQARGGPNPGKRA